MPPANQDAKSVIADSIRTKIESGEYAAGTRVPGENQIAEEHCVAPLTARAALDVLKNESLVVARRGSGTWVRAHGRFADAPPVASQPASGRPVDRCGRPTSRIIGVWQLTSSRSSRAQPRLT